MCHIGCKEDSFPPAVVSVASKDCLLQGTSRGYLNLKKKTRQFIKKQLYGWPSGGG
jgi:hypothetical protein